MKKVLLWVFRILLVPVALFVVLAALLYVPPVQNWAVRQVAGAVSEQTGMGISVDRVSLVFPLDLGIYGFRMTQPSDSMPGRRDTIADVDRLVVDVGLGQLLQGRLTVGALELDGARLNTAGLIATARIRGSIGRLRLGSRGIDLAQGVARVNGASLSDAQVTIELRDTVTPPDTASAPTPWKIYVDRLDIVRTKVALSTPGDTIGVAAAFDRLTARRAVVDLTGGVFAGGQTYVALSRCTSLEGLQLRQPIRRADVFVRPEITQFARRFNNPQAIDRALKQAQADIQYAAAARAFDQGDFDTFLTEFFKAIHSRYDIEQPAAQRLIRRKLNVINRLRQDNMRLRQEAAEKEKALVKYAREYIQMGDECLDLGMKDAAMRNYEKAVTLCPKFKEAWTKIKKLEKELR